MQDIQVFTLVGSLIPTFKIRIGILCGVKKIHAHVDCLKHVKRSYPILPLIIRSYGQYWTDAKRPSTISMNKSCLGMERLHLDQDIHSERLWSYK